MRRTCGTQAGRTCHGRAASHWTCRLGVVWSPVMRVFSAAAQHMRSAGGSHALPPGCAALDLLAALLTYDPVQRLTAQRALQHPFFTEVRTQAGGRGRLPAAVAVALCAQSSTWNYHRRAARAGADGCGCCAVRASGMPDILC